MTGAMYSSIAGLKAHMQKLTVIGNNVANVNTQGYKKQRTIFRDSMYGLYSGGSNGSEIVGSMNPSQLGYGSLVASIDLDMSSSSYAPGNASDCALAGEGFFLVGNKSIAESINPANADSFKALKLTRLGDFHIGADGYLVDGQGNVVYGFMSVDRTYIDPKDEKTKHYVSDQLVPIRLPLAEWVPTGQTAEDGTPVTKYTIRYAQDKEPEDNGTYPADGDYIPLRDYQAPGGNDANTPLPTLENANIESLSIDAGTGAITGTVKGTNEVITIGYLAIGSVSNPNGVSHLDSSYYTCGDGAGELRISMFGGVNEELNLHYVNGSLYTGATTEGGNAGDGENVTPPASSAIFSAGDTKLMPGFLETSNVDLATEISELITTQRGYQANTRIITVTDSMLEELVNMKR